MTINAYITITTSGSEASWKFRVIEGGYIVSKLKAQTENNTLGSVDVSMGTIHEIHEYIIRIRQDRYLFYTGGSAQVEEDDYGILENLDYLYELNNPQGSPSNILTLVDHFGYTHQCFFVGEHSPKPVSVIIEGGGALFMIPIRLRMVPS